MAYIDTISEQAVLFLRACGFGFILGILYEVFRAMRIIFTGSKYIIFWDILYMSVAAITTFLFLLTFSNGTIRTHIFAALIIGWAVFYLTLGKAMGDFTDTAIKAVRRFWDTVLRLITAPFRFVTRLLKKPFGCLKRIITKNLKKVPKILKFHLKFRGGMLYNLRVK